MNLKLNYKLDNFQSLSFTSLSAIDNTSTNPNAKPDDRQDIKVRLFSNGINYENNKHKLDFHLTGFYNFRKYAVDYSTKDGTLQSGIFYLNSTENELGLNAYAKYPLNSSINFDFISGVRYFNTQDTLFSVNWINESDYSSPAEVFLRVWYV